MKFLLAAVAVVAALTAADGALAYSNTTKGAVAGALGGAVVAGPVGLVVGGVGGAVVGKHWRGGHRGHGVSHRPHAARRRHR